MFFPDRLENERYEAELKLKKEQLEFERQLQKNTQIKEIEKAQTELADWEKELTDVDAKLAAAKLENNYEQPGLPNYSSEYEPYYYQQYPDYPQQGSAQAGQWSPQYQQYPHYQVY